MGQSPILRLVSAHVGFLMIVAVLCCGGCDFGAKTKTPTNAPPAIVVKVPKPIPVAFVPAEALLAIAIDPQQMAKSAKLPPGEFVRFQNLLKSESGIDLGQVEQVLTVGGLGKKLPSFFYGSILRYSQPIPREQVMQTMAPNWEEASEGDKKYQKRKDGAGLCLHFADDKTLVVADEETIKRMLSVAADADSPLIQTLRKSDDASAVLTVLEIVPLRPLVGFFTSFSKLPPPFDQPPLSDLKNLAKYLTEATMKIEVEPKLSISVKLDAENEEAAKSTDTLIADCLAHASKMLNGTEEEEASEGNEEEAAPNPLRDVLIQQFEGIVSELKRSQEDDVVNLVVSGRTLDRNVKLLSPLAFGSYLEAWEKDRAARGAANIARVASAFDAYLAAKGTYPAPANLDASGKPLLSWRVHLLPMLGEQALYEEFHLDEPWDSQHNKQLLARIPAVYRPVRQPATGKTQLLLPTGKGTVFSGPEAPKADSVTDDKSQTIVVFDVEEARATEWTKPSDLELDPANPVAGLRRHMSLPLTVIYADGSVGVFDFVKHENDLRALLSPAGGTSDAAPPPPAAPSGAPVKAAS